MGLKNKMIKALNRLTTHIDTHFESFLELGKAQNEALISHSTQLGKMANLNGEMIALLQSIDSVQKEIFARQEVLEAAICELSEGLCEEDEDIGYAEVRKTFDHPDVPISSSLTRFLNNGVAVEVSWSEEDGAYLGCFVDKFPSLSCHGETEDETFETAKNLLEEVLRDLADEEGHPQPHPLAYCRSMDKTQGAITPPPTIHLLDLLPAYPWFIPHAIHPSDGPQAPDFATEVRSLLDYYGHDVQAMPPTEMRNLLEDILAVSSDREEMAKAFGSIREQLEADPHLFDFGGSAVPCLFKAHIIIKCVMRDVRQLQGQIQESYIFDLPRDGSSPTYTNIFGAMHEILNEYAELKGKAKTPHQEMDRIVDLAMEAKKNG